MKMNLRVLIFLCIFVNSNNSFASDASTDHIPDASKVEAWARDIGEYLWNIGSNITNLQQIQQRYSEMNASVEVTDGKEILNTIATRMNRLIKEKVDAVLRIKNAAMEAESSFDPLDPNKENEEEVFYYNSKFSNVTLNNDSLKTTVYDSSTEDNRNYYPMELEANPHFENVFVNTNYSSVHVPTNIFDRWRQVIQPIIWSQKLDETFRMNYNTDSSLMWQYFASTSGFLRHFPAFHWSMNPDRYDCRRRIWYVQAATCSKEVIILIDNSGTMFGMRNTIAQLTVENLLDTFSNNDYINVFRLFNDGVVGLVPCLNDTLIQATPENIELFKSALFKMCPEKKINYIVGFRKAFAMLHDFFKNKTEQPNENRNQAIFLLTDMLPAENDFIEFRNMYEEIYNDTNIQVELFLYFIGKDIPDIREVQWEKCLRNGSIVHVRTMDEVPEDALKYLNVMARTQNESTEYYPVSWTHIFLDIKKDKGRLFNQISSEEIEEEFEDEEYGQFSEHRLMTSVSTPVYASKRKKVSQGDQSQREELIGVAAIDVPIIDFKRLTMAHKIGVNGYAFVVTNNGYLLFHPDLRPLKDGALRENFNSIDLTEVEFYDDNEITPRRPHENIYELRRKMVNQEINEMLGMKIKFHYDDQKRIGCEEKDYYFAPLQCSSFSLGLALPRGYGSYWVKTTNEIHKSKNLNETYRDFFKGKWQIHPDWMYCDYRDNRKYGFSSAEEKLMEFFEKIFHDKDFTWVEEHEFPFNKNQTYNETYTGSLESCFSNDTTKKPHKEYFCDQELVELLYFDAKLTQKEFPEKISEETASFMSKYNISVKFVATQGGLTRWQSNPKNGNDNFGNSNKRVLEEVWYKSAVLLHKRNERNFVFSIPKEYIIKNESKKLITASHAVFYSEGGNEAPGVVVGYQMSYEILKNKIESIPPCVFNNDFITLAWLVQWDCYVIDANGYVIYSRKKEEIGNFFGSLQGGAAMDILVSENKFRKIPMFDYQSLTDVKKSDPIRSSSSSLMNPVTFVIAIFNWVISQMVWLMINSNIWQYVNAASTSCQVTSTTNTASKNKSCPVCCKAPKEYADACQAREVLPHMLRVNKDARSKKKAVDKRYFLYLMTNFGDEVYSHRNNDNHHDNCSRPFFAVKIAKTNLILLLLDAWHETCTSSLSVEQEDIIYDALSPEDRDVPACNKKMINSYPRKKLRGCGDKILQNRTRESCGSASLSKLNTSLVISWLAFKVIFFKT